MFNVQIWQILHPWKALMIYFKKLQKNGISLQNLCNPFIYQNLKTESGSKQTFSLTPHPQVGIGLSGSADLKKDTFCYLMH